MKASYIFYTQSLLCISEVPRNTKKQLPIDHGKLKNQRRHGCCYLFWCLSSNATVCLFTFLSFHLGKKEKHSAEKLVNCICRFLLTCVEGHTFSDSINKNFCWIKFLQEDLQSHVDEEANELENELKRYTKPNWSGDAKTNLSGRKFVIDTRQSSENHAVILAHIDVNSSSKEQQTRQSVARGWLRDLSFKKERKKERKEWSLLAVQRRQLHLRSKGWKVQNCVAAHDHDHCLNCSQALQIGMEVCFGATPFVHYLVQPLDRVARQSFLKRRHEKQKFLKHRLHVTNLHPLSRSRRRPHFGHARRRGTFWISPIVVRGQSRIAGRLGCSHPGLPQEFFAVAGPVRGQPSGCWHNQQNSKRPDLAQQTVQMTRTFAWFLRSSTLRQRGHSFVSHLSKRAIVLMWSSNVSISLSVKSATFRTSQYGSTLPHLSVPSFVLSAGQVNI